MNVSPSQKYLPPAARLQSCAPSCPTWCGARAGRWEPAPATCPSRSCVVTLLMWCLLSSLVAANIGSCSSGAQALLRNTTTNSVFSSIMLVTDNWASNWAGAPPLANLNNGHGLLNLHPGTQSVEGGHVSQLRLLGPHHCSCWHWCLPQHRKWARATGQPTSGAAFLNFNKLGCSPKVSLSVRFFWAEIM